MIDQDLLFEKNYWNNCCNTFIEERKQFTYGKLMGLEQQWFNFMVDNKSILDIGGGPTSMLLKTFGLTKGKVYDPIEYPAWTIARYKCKGIDVAVEYGENVNESGWDEVWIYNCLQHVTDPAKIIDNAKRAAKVLRIFEWIDIPPHEGHPHMLTKDFLDKCIGQEGNVCELNDNESCCWGRAYYGAFVL